MSADVIQHEHTYNKLNYCTECLIKKGNDMKTTTKEATHTPTPLHWNKLHDEAIDKLSKGLWMPLEKLRNTPTDGSVVFDDLVAWNKAEVKKEPIIKNGISCGEKTFYRLKLTEYDGMLFKFADEDIIQVYTQNEKTLAVKAAFIVRAVNSHEALINAVKNFLSDYDSNHGYMGAVEELRSIAKQAEGK